MGDRGVPLRFTPAGTSDTLESSTAFPGAMAALINLVPDPTTKGVFVSRPAAIQLTDFSTSGITAPGFISAGKQIGTRFYGMVAAGGALVGHDVPFCFDVAAQAFVTISGILAANTPTNATSTGAWTPPTMDLIGTKLIVTHPGFTGGGGIMFGWIDLNDPTTPAWSSGNTAPTALPVPPVAVKQFNGRAYYLCNPLTGNPGAYYSDSLLALVITNATQVVTFDDNIPLMAVGALPFNNQQGGVIQALIVFKGKALDGSFSTPYQLTGDPALGNFARNALNVATSTLAPRTIVGTPKGLAFIAPDGLRFIDFTGNVSDVVGAHGDGISVPFSYGVVPSRMAAAFAGNILRISTQNGFAPGNPQQEWWLDFKSGVWTGPHSFPASVIEPYGNSFVMAAVGVLAKLWRSNAMPTATDTYVENGTQLGFNYQTSLLPDTDQMCENSIVEATLYMAYAPSGFYSVNMANQDGQVLDSVALQAPAAATLWGQFVWGQALWQGATSALAPRRLSWSKPIVFRRAGLSAVGNCAPGVRIGALHMMYQPLGYLQQAS